MTDRVRTLMARAILGGCLALAAARGRAAGTGSTTARPAATAVRAFEVSRDGGGVVAKLEDGSRVVVCHYRGRLFGIAEVSKSRRWAILQWSAAREARGSRAGSIVAHASLASIEDRRCLNVEDLDIPEASSFLGFAEENGVEVLAVGVRKGIVRIPLSQIASLIKTHGRKTP